MSLFFFKKFKRVAKVYKKISNFTKVPQAFTYKIISKNFGYLTIKQLFIVNRFLNRYNRYLKVFILQKTINLTTLLTKKAVTARMGKGVGKPFFWVSFLKPGSEIFKLFCKHLISNSFFNKLKCSLPFDFYIKKNSFLLLADLQFYGQVSYKRS